MPRNLNKTAQFTKRKGLLPNASTIGSANSMLAAMELED